MSNLGLEKHQTSFLDCDLADVIDLHKITIILRSLDACD